MKNVTCTAPSIRIDQPRAVRILRGRDFGEDSELELVSNADGGCDYAVEHGGLYLTLV